MRSRALAFATAWLSSLLFTTPVYALQMREIYPAPLSGESEWVEVFNDTDGDDDLAQYTLEDETGKSIIFESSPIGPKGYSKALSSNTLNNTGDTIILKKSGAEIQRVTFPGSISSSQSYSYCFDSWSIQSPTPLRENSCIPPTQIPEQPTNTSLPSQAETTTYSDYSSVYITEVFAYPENGGEWVELYNSNDTSVTLSLWYIDDGENSGSSPFSFSKTIEGRSYGIIDVSLSMFNNDGDWVRLLNHDKVQKHTISFTDAIKGKSMGVTTVGNSSTCLQEPSKGQINNECRGNTTQVVTKATGKITIFPTGKTVSPTKKAASSIPTRKVSLVENLVESKGDVLAATDTKPEEHTLQKKKPSEKQRILAGIALFISMFSSAAIVYTLKKRLNL